MKINDRQIEQRIVERSAQIIFQRGIKGLNMDQLSAEVGVAKNTLYKMINSKEELIEKVILGYIRNVQAKVAGVMGEGLGYITALERMAGLFPELLNSLYADAMQEIFREYPSIEATVRAHRDEITGRIITFIRQGIADGVLRSDLTPELVFETLQAVVLHFIKSGAKGPELSGKLKLALSLLINGIKA